MQLAAVAAATALLALIYTVAIDAAPFHTKGEPREGLVVQAMARDGHWVLPRRNGDEIASKPPLFHWIASSVAIATGRIEEAAVRSPSSLAAIVLAAWTFAFGARRFGFAAGVAAAGALVTMQQFIASAVTARVDMVFAAALAGTAFFAAGAAADRRPVGAGFFLLTSLAVLTKGPAGYVLPIATLAAYGLATRTAPSALVARPLVAVAICGLPLLWYGAAWMEGGQAFLDRLIFKENVYRVLDPDSVKAGHVRPFWFYVPSLFGSAAPWSVLFPVTAAGLWRGRSRLFEAGNPRGYLVLWIVVTVVLYSASPSKRSVYLLPIFPTLALLVGGWIANYRTSPGSPGPGPAVKAALGLLSAVMVAAAAAIAGQALGLETFAFVDPLVGNAGDKANLQALAAGTRSQPVRLVLWAAGAAGLVLAGLRFAFAERVRPAAGALSLCILWTLAVGGIPLHAAMAERQSPRDFVRGMIPRLPSGAQPYHFGEVDYAVPFYAGRDVPPPDAAVSSGRNPAWFFVWESDLEALCPPPAAECRIAGRHDYFGNPKRTPLLVVEKRSSSPADPEP